MKLYPYQVEIIDALRSGKNVVRAGSRRVGLTTAVLLFIESEIKNGEFRALVYTRNPRSLLGLIKENKNALPIMSASSQLREGNRTLPSLIQVTNTMHPHVDFVYYDEVDLPNQQVPSQWALINTHGMCKLPHNIHMPFEFMEGVSYLDIPQNPTPDSESNEKLRTCKLGQLWYNF